MDGIKAWVPTTRAALQFLIFARAISVFFNNISDCDETYNYWEPAHFLMHGAGFQTWEYSPVYALRSYTYLCLHVLPLLLVGTRNKMVQFYTLRAILGLICALCELYFYRAVKQRFGPKIALWMLLFLVPSCGMFIASTAFLPSSFAMYCMMLAIGSWLQGCEWLAIFTTALGALLGWPFSVVLGIPLAYDIVVNRRRVVFFFICSLISFITVAGPMVYIDSQFYGRTVLPPLNLINYNLFRGGHNLYGTEPWTYYFINGILNFNLVFLLGLAAWPLLELKGLMDIYVLGKKTEGDGKLRLSLLPLVIWVLIFFTRPHKEERFLFPIYPLVCFSAVISLFLIQEMVPVLTACLRFPKSFRASLSAVLSWLPLLACIIHALLAISRGMALYDGYGAPLKLFRGLNSQYVLSYTAHLKGEIHVCISKEWYRFPSSYFLPDKIIMPYRPRWLLEFIKSDFHGQLPKQFSSLPNATAIVPEAMNDANKEEPSRYFDLEHCHFLVDLDTPSFSPLEPRYTQDHANWEVLLKFPFLDASRSHPLFRAFHFPGLSQDKVTYGQYVLLRNKRVHFPKTHNDDVPLKSTSG